jgi:hypothetical protein
VSRPILGQVASIQCTQLNTDVAYVATGTTFEPRLILFGNYRLHRLLSVQASQHSDRRLASGLAQVSDNLSLHRLYESKRLSTGPTTRFTTAGMTRASTVDCGPSAGAPVPQAYAVGAPGRASRLSALCQGLARGHGPRLTPSSSVCVGVWGFRGVFNGPVWGVVGLLADGGELVPPLLPLRVPSLLPVVRLPPCRSPLSAPVGTT